MAIQNLADTVDIHRRHELGIMDLTSKYSMPHH
jgi:hypothetical protein